MTEPPIPSTDNYQEALNTLFGITVKLYGGYYEPKSARDKQLADELNDIWEKHIKEPLQ